MAKELPYFQFEPAEYLTRDISFCSLSTQGLFINVCAYYWQRQCELTKTQFLKRLNHPIEFDELVNEGVIDLIEDVIRIKFLDEQFEKATNLSKVNSANGSKGGRPKKENPIKTEIKPNQNPIESETKGIREDKIKEKEIIKEEIKENTSVVPPSIKFDFRKSLLNFGFDSKLVEEWLKIRKTKKAVNTETALNGFLNEIKKNKSTDPNSILRVCVERSWSGFKSEWLNNLNLSKNGISQSISRDEQTANYTQQVLESIGKQVDGKISSESNENGSDDFTTFTEVR